jgi:hypothetical protein
MQSFEGIIDKITVCKKLKSFTEEIFKKLSKNLQIGPFKNRFVTMATGIFNDIFYFS